MKLGQLIDIVMDNLLKVTFTTFLLVCFLSLNESFCETRKMFFTSKALFVLEKISKNFRSSNFMTSSMLKHKTRNIFYWITWGVNIVFQWNFASLCYITKENVLSKNSTKNANWKLVSSNLLIICNTKTMKICQNQHAHLLRLFFKEDSMKIKKGLELVSRLHFSYFFDKHSSFVILYKLIKFRYQTVFTFQVIQ